MSLFATKMALMGAEKHQNYSSNNNRNEKDIRHLHLSGMADCSRRIDLLRRQRQLRLQGTDCRQMGSKSYYHWYHDFTDESLSSERTYTLSDTNYIGYDSAEFNTTGTMRWHMNDRYVSSGMFSDPYINFEWRIKGDSLFVSPNWVADAIAKYAIKELNSEALVIEQYLDNEHPEYSYHHWEQIHRYTFSRCKK